MEVSKELVEHLARLARLDLVPDEVETLAAQMREIVVFVEWVRELGGEPRRAEDLPAMPMRDDEVRAGLTRELIESNAPAWVDGHIAVPPVLPAEEP